MAGRRQVLSYSDSFAAPSGEVDLEAPLPSLTASAGPSGSWAAAEPSSHDAQYQDGGYWGPPSGSNSYPPLHDGAPSPSVQPLYYPSYQSGGFFPHPAAPSFYPQLSNGHQPQQGYPTHSQAHIPTQHQPPPTFDSAAPPPSAPRAVREAAAKSRRNNGTPKSNAANPSPWCNAHQQTYQAPSTPNPSNHVRIPIAPVPARMPWPHSSYRAWTAVIIEDCDESSDEEDDDAAISPHPESSTRRLLGRSIRQQTMKDVSQLWAKLQKASPALQPKTLQVPTSATASERVSPVPTPPSPAVKPLAIAETQSANPIEKELSDYEKKQKEIQAMMDKIKKLEQARLKGKAKVSPHSQTPPLSVTTPGDTSSVAPATSSDTIAARSLPSTSSQRRPPQAAPHAEQGPNAEQGLHAQASPTLPRESGVHIPLVRPSAEPPTITAAGAPSVPKVALNPALAEQKRLLLARMQQARMAIQSQKRKADHTDENQLVSSVAANGVGDGEIAPRLPQEAEPGNPATTSKSGSEEFQAKRQRRSGSSGQPQASTVAATAALTHEPS